MQFRQTSQSDDRRRRVLTEEVVGGSAPAADGDAASTAAPTKRRRRTRSRLPPPPSLDGQPRIIDLVPRKIGLLALLLFGGLAIIGGLEGLYAWMPVLAKTATDGRIEAFDLDGEGSLAVWFSSATLSLAGLTSLLIYSVRRQRLDDYHGRYRIWLWAGLCWFLMSLDETGSLHEGYKELMSQLTGRRLLGDGSIWWVATYIPLLGIVGIRAVLEMRQNRAAIFWLVSAGLLYAVAVLAQLQVLLPESGAKGVMLEEGCEMAGNLLLLLAMAVHARYRVLEAEGLLEVREEKTRRRWFRRSADAAQTAEAETDSSSSTTRKRRKRTDAATPSSDDQKPKAPSTPPSKPAVSNPIANKPNLRVDPPQNSVPKPKMSKAERRAQRKQQTSDHDLD